MKHTILILFVFASCSIWIEHHEPQKNRTITLTQDDGIGESPDSFVAADVNNDDFIDLAITSFLDDNLSILLGNGNSFQISQTINIHLPRTVSFGDINDDNFLDLITLDFEIPIKSPSDSGRGMSIFIGNGDGTFQPATSFSNDSDNVPPVIIEDLNGDNIPDMIDVAAIIPSPDISGSPLSVGAAVFLGNGDGTFQPRQCCNPLGEFVRNATIGDLNGDSFSDLVTANRSSNDASILLGNGDGTFQPELRFPAGIAPFGVALSDLNRDGFLDVTISNSISNDVSLLFGNGDGTFQETQAVQAGINPDGIVIGLFDDDNFLDIVTANRVSDDVCLLSGNGDGSFKEPQFFAVSDAPVNLAAADLNNDGSLDLVTSSDLGREVTVLFGVGQ